MKTRILLLFAFTLAGCVPSWNPFYKEKDLRFDPALIGHWRPVKPEENSKENWAFARAGDQLYRLTQTDEEGRKAEFDARLFKLKEHLFLDLYLVKVEGDEMKLNALASCSLLPAHLLLRVEQIEPALKIAVLNPDWMQEHLKQHPDALPHRKLNDGNIVLAAGTDDLQKFLLAHLNDKDFLGGAMELKKAGPSNAGTNSAE
jgi:hypothetical protein